MVFPFLSSSPIVRLLSPIPECGKSLLAIRNPAQGINNFANDWNPESSPWNLESGMPGVESRLQDRLKLHYMRRLAPQSGSQLWIFWINLSFWETAHLPLPYANINTYFSLRAKWWLRGGVGVHFPRNLKWSNFFIIQNLDIDYWLGQTRYEKELPLKLWGVIYSSLVKR